MPKTIETQETRIRHLEMQLDQAHGANAQIKSQLARRIECCPSCMSLRGRLHAAQERLAEYEAKGMTDA